MHKLTGAKKLYRRYELLTDWRPSFEFEDFGGGVIEFPASLEPELKTQWLSHQKQILEEKAKEMMAMVSKIKTIEIDVPQRSPEWFKARAGLITGSDTPFALNGKPIPTFDEYVYKKVADSFKGYQSESVKTQAMQDGIELEALALKRYAESTGFEVQEKGFYKIDGYRVGASPDAIAFDEDLNPYIVEVKNVQLNTYIGELVNPSQAQKYKAQIQTEMLCSGIHRATLVVQCAFEPERFELLIYEIAIDPEFIANMVETIELFEQKFEYAHTKLLEKLQSKEHENGL